MQNHSFGIPPHTHYPPPPPLPPPEAVPRPPRRRRGKISKYKTGHYGMDPVSYNNAGMSNFGESSGQADIPIEETDSEDDGLGETFERGSRFEIKDLYSVRRKDNPYVFHWVDEKPESLEDAKKKKTTRLRDTFAVNLFHLCNESKGEWFVHELRVNSPDARAALETILEGYPDLTRHDLKSFRPPFLPFVHRWADLLAYLERSEVPERIVSQLTFLQTVLQSLLKDSFDKLEDISKTGHVAFDDLPLIYVPGMTAVENATNTAGVIRSCVDSSNNRSLWEIKVDVVDWDGRNCGLRSQSWSISKYQGMRAISALAVSPIDRIPEEDDLRRRLIERGRKFEKLRGQFFLAYSDEYEERRDERVVVDARAYYKHEKAKFPIFEKLSTIGRLTWEQSMNRVSTTKQLHRSQPPTCWDDGSVKVTQHVDTEPTTEVALSPLTDEQCLLAFPYLWCFNINKKEWEHLKLTNLHEIRFAERAFDNLVLDQGEKDLLLALAERDWSKRGSSSFDDFVGSKGQGMVMLLCGPPGVGKTLTAETVAEHLRRPLYRLGASDLGSHATIVEQCLSKALKLCADFSAVLLLDEADVFMEARSTNNLIRNELVSVFLRLLEYYEGIMILTTNRIRSIDPAFESRIDITLSYNSLSKEDRIKVWRNFLVTLDTADVDISDTDMVKLARWDFNGRQIKSAIKTARILAAKKQEPLKASHLEVVLRLRSASLHVMSGVVESDRS